MFTTNGITFVSDPGLPRDTVMAHPDLIRLLEEAKGIRAAQAADTVLDSSHWLTNKD